MDELYNLIDEMSEWMGITLDNELRKEIHFRVCDFNDTKKEKVDHIKACFRYVITYGKHALINELDDGNIWDYI